MSIQVQVPTPVEATYQAKAKWIVSDLLQRGADRANWDQDVDYLLPAADGERVPVVRASTHTAPNIAVMPQYCGETPGVWFPKHELLSAENTVFRRVRLAIMRACR